MFQQLVLAALTLGCGCNLAFAQLIDPEWVICPGIYSPAEHGAVILDLDGDGYNEAVVSGSVPGSKDFLVILQNRNGALQITRRIQSPSGSSFVGKLQVFPATSGGEARLAVVTYSPTGNILSTFSGINLRWNSDVPLPSGFTPSQLADVDANGTLEVLGSLSLGQPMVLDATTGAVKWGEAGTQSSEIAAGQLDQDPALEIVIGNHGSATPGRILDGATFAEEWTYPNGFRGVPVFGNFDGDSSTPEFAIVEPQGFTRLFASSPAFAPISDHETGYVDAFLAQDLNADGVTDLTFGQGDTGGVITYSPDTWATLFEHANPENDVTELAAGQLDADAGLEVLFGMGSNTSSTDRLRVFDWQTHAIEFDQIAEVGPHSSVLVDDLDGDGSTEVVAAGFPNQFSGARLRVADAETGEVLRSVENPHGPWSANYGSQLLSANLDSDAQREILVSQGMGYAAVLQALDSTTLQEQWEFSEMLGSGPFSALALVDANHDAFPDIAGTMGQDVVVINGADGYLLWRYDDLGTFNTGASIVVANVDNDPAAEILASDNGVVFVLDAESHLLEDQFSTATPIVGMSVEGEDISCRLILYFQSSLERRRCDTYAVDSTRAYAVGPVKFVRAVEGSTGPLVLADDQKVMLQDGSNIVATSTDIGPGLGWNNYATVLRDGGLISVVVGGMASIQRVELSGDSIFQHGFE